jgi:SPP1 gp7 family putative phage head morphogenesis protein
MKNKKPKRLSPIKESRAVELYYYKELRKIVKEMENDVRNELYPALSEAKITTDNNPLVTLWILANLREKWGKIDLIAKNISSNFVNKLNNVNRDKFLKSVNRGLGIDIETMVNEKGLNDIVALQRQKNEVLIKSIPEEFFKGIEIEIQNGISNGLRPEQIKKNMSGIKGIRSLFGKLENRIKMIARQETAVINSQLTKARYESAGVELYEWSTSEDERVRESHRVLNGKICKMNDNTVYADSIEDAKKGKWKKRSSIGAVELAPGIDFNCRCTRLPLFVDD